ncbi:MAG: hypothetical protein H6Q05_3350 [Acidobacteria bacterium]|nr:hypothetical protein [Acidobacteriota bacterium]
MVMEYPSTGNTHTAAAVAAGSEDSHAAAAKSQ